MFVRQQCNTSSFFLKWIAQICSRNIKQFSEYQGTYLKWISNIINFSRFSYVQDWYLLLLLLLQFCGCVHATITIFLALLDGHFIQKKQMLRLWTQYHLFWNTAYQQKIKLLYHNNSSQEKAFDENTWTIQEFHTKRHKLYKTCAYMIGYINFDHKLDLISKFKSHFNCIITYTFLKNHIILWNAVLLSPILFIIHWCMFMKQSDNCINWWTILSSKQFCKNHAVYIYTYESTTLMSLLHWKCL